nr:DUF3380 domain-containing protein [Pseudomonadota bacterium]
EKMPEEVGQRRQKKGIVTASVLNVRPEPSTDKPPVGQLKRGTSVVILRHHNSWFEIRADGIEGFVYGDYVTVQDDQPTAGFLVDREDLRTIALEPPESERITVQPDFSDRQKVAGRTWNRQGGLLEPLSITIEVEVAATVAVLCVESRGRGYGPEGRMIIRFENHIFWRQWGRHNQDVFSEHFRFNAKEKWKNHEFRENVNEGWANFHGNQRREWPVFDFARALDESAAMRSISMGGPQIMGFNHPSIGFDSVREMFDAFQSNIRYQILGLFDFLKGPGTTSPMVVALQRKKFTDFASLYNGPGQAAKYGSLIEDYFELFGALRGAA